MAAALIGGAVSGTASAVWNVAGVFVGKFLSASGRYRDGLSSADIDILMKIDELCADGPLKRPFADSAGVPADPPWQWRPVNPSKVSRAPVRRAAEKIREMLKGDAKARTLTTARTVFAARLGHWVDNMCMNEPDIEEVNWWISLLMAIVDKQIFTGSNLVNKSSFENMLNDVKQQLVTLRASLSCTHKLTKLRRGLEDVVNKGDLVMDRLKDFLKSAMHHVSCDEVHQGVSRAVDDVYEMLSTTDNTDRFGIVWARAVEVHCSPDGGKLDSLKHPSASTEEGSILEIARILCKFLGGEQNNYSSQAVSAYLELFGLLFHFAASLFRMTLLLDAVWNIGQNAASLPLYKSGIVDTRDVLPLLLDRICGALRRIADHYTSLERVAGDERQSVLELCRSIDDHLKSMKLRVLPDVLADLMCCASLSQHLDRQVPRAWDVRWNQVTNVSVAAQALLNENQQALQEAGSCATLLEVALHAVPASQPKRFLCAEHRDGVSSRADCGGAEGTIASTAAAHRGDFVSCVADEGTVVHTLVFSMSQNSCKFIRTTTAFLEQQGGVIADSITKASRMLGLADHEHRYDADIYDGDWEIVDDT